MAESEHSLIHKLARDYNYQNLTDRRQVYVDLVLDEMSRYEAPCVLDVGCGNGISAMADGESFVAQIRKQASEMWGLDPALTEAPKHGMMDNFRHGTAEAADLPAEHFDVAYSFMVLEHVSEPEEFFTAIYKSLKPGGTFVLCTVNARHYFTLIANAARCLRIDEWLLRVVKGQQAEEYHFPTRYRCNSARKVQQTVRRVGFEQADIAYSEEAAPLGYFPGPLRVVPYFGDMRRRRSNDPSLLLTMYIVVRKPAS